MNCNIFLLTGIVASNIYVIYMVITITYFNIIYAHLLNITL